MDPKQSATRADPSSIPVFVAVGVLGLLLALAVFIDDLPARVILSLAALAGAQGLWRGISETLGVVVGFLLSAILALPLGRLIEPAFGAMGIGGLAGRLCAFALVTAVCVGICAFAGRKIGKTLIQHIPALAAWDRIIGAGLGSIYGVLLGTFLLFIPLALEPVAIAQGARPTGAPARNDDGPAPSPAAMFVVGAAEQIRASPAGPAIAAISPVKDLSILNVAADFAAVSRDRVALDHLLATPVFRDLAKHPTINDAIDRFKADPELRGLIEREKGVSATSLIALVTSPVITDLLDKSTIIEDLRPRTDEMIAAIREARAKVGGQSAKP